MSNVFTAPQGTKVFYKKDGKTEIIEFKTGKLELNDGNIIDACKRHPKVLEVKNAPKVKEVEKEAKIEAKKEEKSEDLKMEEAMLESHKSVKKSEEKKVKTRKRNIKSIKKD